MDVAFVLVAVLAAFYFILLRPVINQQKKQRQDISSLEIGDEVLTTGGFYAIVVEINTYEDRPMEILLEVAPDVVLRGTTLSIAEISRRADEIDDEYDDTDDDDSDEDDGGGDVSPAGESDDEDRSSSARAG
ncbi:MAG: preprotein translocase subunit YajC [Dehalococcoidia bacterium]|nr:preprotein translocase subunit YajC [Dehalococcoidia bacterium]MCA9857798.1 preprotein translocase subunit YajC [Dehalococcoidia bacterium]MCB9491754.1 preprotein translocase subunit YajC [Dehalococcoidia bacterium]